MATTGDALACHCLARQDWPIKDNGAKMGKGVREVVAARSCACVATSLRWRWYERETGGERARSPPLAARLSAVPCDRPAAAAAAAATAHS